MSTIWQAYGLADFPLTQPMVGQKEFYKIFRNFKNNHIDQSKMANIFAMIAKWGVGKSRMGYEIVSQILEMDKGWIFRENNHLKGENRIFKPNFEDKTLPLFIQYASIANPQVMGDNLIAWGIYRSLSLLAQLPDMSSSGRIIDQVQNRLLPMGFFYRQLAQILEIDKHSDDELLNDDKLLDQLVTRGMDYLKKLGFDKLLIVVDEVETIQEVVQLHEREDDLSMYRLDQTGLMVLGQALKNNNVRTKFPFANFLLLCSPVVGRSITELGALQRRVEVLEVEQNNFSDIHDFITYLGEKKLIPFYPEGLVEAAYIMAGGNFGWFNVIMYEVDNYLSAGNNDQSISAVFAHLQNTSSLFRNHIIDEHAFKNLELKDQDKLFVINKLMLQIPHKIGYFTNQQLELLRNSKNYDGLPLFKEFYRVIIEQGHLAAFLNSHGYRREIEDIFTDQTGNKIDLDIFLRALKTYSVSVEGENDYLVGADETTFREQLRMLYPNEGAEQIARLLFEYIKPQIDSSVIDNYIGPNFSFLEQMNIRYRNENPAIGYVKDPAKNSKVEEELRPIVNTPSPEVLLKGLARILEQTYPEENLFEVEGVSCLGIKVQKGPYLDSHPENWVTFIWGKDSSKLTQALKSNTLLKRGVHPILVVSDEPFDTKLKEKLTGPGWEGIGKCLVFIEIPRIYRDIVVAVSLSNNLIDLRQSKGEITASLREKITKVDNYVSEKVREWFNQLDEDGWVLRPLIHKNASDSEVELIVETYKRMTINRVSFVELGTQSGIKLERDQYDEMKSLLFNKTFLSYSELSNDYRETGLFVKAGQDFEVQVPAALTRIMNYLAGMNRRDVDFRHTFFFSSDNLVKANKIVSQWFVFLQKMGVAYQQDGFLNRTSSIDLQNTYKKVDNWYHSEFEEALKHIATLIKGGTIENIYSEKPYISEKLQDAKNTLDKCDPDRLGKFEYPLEDNWTEELSYLESFYGSCRYIYDREKYNAITFNQDEIKNVRLDDSHEPLWRRIGLITKFLEYLVVFKTKAVSKLEEKINEIKKNTIHQGYQLPVSPVINILERYKNELEWANDFHTLSKKPFVGKETETIACNLTVRRFDHALLRLEKIISHCGLEMNGLEVYWKDRSGIIGEYEDGRNKFMEAVDYFFSDEKEIKHWVNYFEGSNLRGSEKDYWENLKRNTEEFEIHLERGFNQYIDDLEQAKASEAEEFLAVWVKFLKELSEFKHLIAADLRTVIDRAREKKNESYDEDLVKAISIIRRAQHEDPLILDKGTYPDDMTFLETIEKIKKQSIEWRIEADAYLKRENLPLEFFLEVVRNPERIDWDDRTQELQALIKLRLVRTKIELI